MAGHPIFTQSWADAYQQALNANDAYAEAAEDWEGPLAFQVRASPNHGIEDDRAVLLDLWHGECRKASAVDGPRATKASDYVIAGDRSTWVEVLEGRLQPLKALMFGKLKLEKGKLRDLLPYTRAAKEMVESAQEVDTEL